MFVCVWRACVLMDARRGDPKCQSKIVSTIFILRTITIIAASQLPASGRPNHTAVRPLISSYPPDPCRFCSPKDEKRCYSEHPQLKVRTGWPGSSALFSFPASRSIFPGWDKTNVGGWVGWGEDPDSDNPEETGSMGLCLFFASPNRHFSGFPTSLLQMSHSSIRAIFAVLCGEANGGGEGCLALGKHPELGTIVGPSARKDVITNSPNVFAVCTFV